MLISCAFFDLSNFLSDPLHRIDKAINLGLVLRLSRFDHETTYQWPRNCRCMESVVHKSLGDILLRDSSLLLDGIQIDDELVGDSSLLTSILNSVVACKLLSHVICVENRFLGALQKTRTASESDVSVSNWQDTCITVRCSIDSSICPAINRHDTMTR